MSTRKTIYCEELSIHVPVLEEMDLNKFNYIELMVLVLLENGFPMKLEQITTRLTEAGVTSRIGKLSLSLKKAINKKSPVIRLPTDEYDLMLDNDKLYWFVRKNDLLKNKPQQRPFPSEPVVPDDIEPLSEKELSNAIDGNSYGRLSSRRLTVGVLDVYGPRLALAEIEKILVTLSKKQVSLSLTTIIYKKSDLITIEASGVLSLNRSSPELCLARKAIRQISWPIIKREMMSAAVKDMMRSASIEAEARQIVEQQETAKLERAIISEAMTGSNCHGLAVLNFKSRKIDVLTGSELEIVSDLLNRFQVIVAIKPRELLHTLGLDSRQWQTIDLDSAQKTRKLNRRGRILKITPEMLISHSTGISKPLGDKKKIKEYIKQNEMQKLKRRLTSNIKSLYAFYRYALLHHAVRLRWGFLDEMIGVDWGYPCDLSLYELAKESMKKQRPVEIVVRTAPGWKDPWSRAIRGMVTDIDSTYLDLIVDGWLERFLRWDIQAIRIM
ncbi:hypothetical protein ACFL27_05240 [candidate division CSSED10-310 bacterium]|uniref:Uncharacterized protein n=1 Tax=candidate division CSSED10-310 bacterium TaxID=2855610 RepID=A0ABV6YTR0_UNCC1